MDIDNVSFYPVLLDILTDVSEAHFISFDLELSGVCSKSNGGGKGPGKPLLQDRYLETKEAAERYQILQIGLTCVSQDLESGKYVLKPYNFDISPIIAERGLDIERIFSYQSGAVEFLLKNGFDMSRPFTRGVPYMSRKEAREARDKSTKRNAKSTIADIQIKDTDTQMLAFMERCRAEIDAWLADKTYEAPDYVNIGVIGAGTVKDGGPLPELSRFEKRLVHQLVRAEYQDLVTISRKNFVQIVRFDQEREDRILADRKKELEERLNRQKGFRWIIEAMLGNDISNLDLRECARDPITGEPIFYDADEYKAKFARARSLLRYRPKVIIGHNCFLDLVYLYRHFIGQLPDTVEEFQRKLHGLWPVVVDTKYMATHNCGDINPTSSLEQINAQLASRQTPTVETAEYHVKYKDAQMFHEAGFDSFLTAQVAVRLSSKLEAEGAYVDADGVEDSDEGDVGGVSLEGNGEKETGTVGKAVDAAKGTLAAAVQKLGLNGEAPTNGHASGTAQKLTDANLETHDRPPPASDSGIEPENFVQSVPGSRWKNRGEPTLPPAAAGDPFTYNPRDRKHMHKETEAEANGIEGGMPRFGTDFWRVYGNKLRVFGTEEGVCLLDDGARKEVEKND